jgi:thiamine-phosphate pyrophosphorylase
MADLSDRCRLVLVAPAADTAEALVERLEAALSGGDVASVLLPQRDLDDKTFQTICAAVVPVIQAAGVAALVAGDSRVAGRVKADGLFVAENAESLREAIEKHTPSMIVGGGNARDRHTALAIGEAEPDFIFFGKLDGDIKPEPHRKNLALAEWWASMVGIPCILMGGEDASHALAMAETGAEFIAFGKAVFEAGDGPKAAVSGINAVLDEKAPRFED